MTAVPQVIPFLDHDRASDAFELLGALQEGIAFLPCCPGDLRHVGSHIHQLLVILACLVDYLHHLVDLKLLLYVLPEQLLSLLLLHRVDFLLLPRAYMTLDQGKDSLLSPQPHLRSPIVEVSRQQRNQLIVISKVLDFLHAKLGTEDR